MYPDLVNRFFMTPNGTFPPSRADYSVFIFFSLPLHAHVRILNVGSCLFVRSLATFLLEVGRRFPEMAPPSSAFFS